MQPILALRSLVAHESVRGLSSSGSDPVGSYPELTVGSLSSTNRSLANQLPGTGPIGNRIGAARAKRSSRPALSATRPKITSFSAQCQDQNSRSPSRAPFAATPGAGRSNLPGASNCKCKYITRRDQVSRPGRTCGSSTSVREPAFAELTRDPSLNR